MMIKSNNIFSGGQSRQFGAVVTPFGNLPCLHQAIIPS
jgi:hypothetical protein